jgi:hypothetical protein
MASAWATFGAYSLMMILSWLWGQKHYPIKYNMPRIAFYFIFCAIIYFGFESISFHSVWLRNLVAVLFLLSFAATAFMIERKELPKVL